MNKPCKCKLSLGSFEQCEPADVTVRNWKPEYLSQSEYLVPTGNESDVEANPYIFNADASKLVLDMSHMEPSEQEQMILTENKTTANLANAKFFMMAGLAYLLLK